MNTWDDVTELIGEQNSLIRIQSDVIDELCRMLLQHISSEELGRLPCWDKIQKAADLMKRMEV